MPLHESAGKLSLVSRKRATVRYYQLGLDELKQEREKQLEVVKTSTVDDYLDEFHKLSVMDSLITWHTVEAFRSGGVKQKAVRKAKPNARKQAGTFEFGRARREELPALIVNKRSK
jgi:hypothetical protein